MTEQKRGEKRENNALIEEQAQLAKVAHEKAQLVLKQQCIRAGIKDAESYAADLAIADFFYANAIPFSARGTVRGSKGGCKLKFVMTETENQITEKK